MLFTGVSSGLQVYNQIEQGRTAGRVAKYNNEQATLDAEAQKANLEAEARNQEAETMEQTKRARINQRRAMATQRASLSSQGTLTTTGTGLAILGETAGSFQTMISDATRASAMQTASIRRAGEVGVWDAKRKNTMRTWEAKQAKKASTLSAIGTGIQGVQQAVSAYGHNKYTGAIS